MQVNLTLFGQFITFFLLVFFTVKYIWPPLTTAMNNRRKTIADGLSAAEEGYRTLEGAKEESKEIIDKANNYYQKLIKQAALDAAKVIEDAKKSADISAANIIKNASIAANNFEIDLREKLSKEMSELVIHRANKLLASVMTAELQDKLMHNLIEEIKDVEE